MEEGVKSAYYLSPFTGPLLRESYEEWRQREPDYWPLPASATRRYMILEPVWRPA